MAIKTLAQLKAVAAEIKTETEDGANSASKVGTFFDDILDSLDSMRGHLWEFSLDTLYPIEATPQAILQGVRTKMQLDTPIYLSSPNHVITPIWNTTTQKFMPLIADDFYIFRFAITGKYTQGSTASFLFEFDVSTGTQPIIAKETKVFVKGNGVAQSFNLEFGLFAGPDFLTNGGEVYITPDQNASFWEIAATIDRTYSTPV